MIEKIKKIARIPFVRNVTILASGTAGAQLIGMLLSPIITRLYGPEAYGIMGTFTAIVSIISPVAALTFPIAIVLPRQKSESIGLIRLSILISTIISVLVGLIILLLHQPIIQIFKLSNIAPYLYLVPVIIFCAGFSQVIEQWLIRTKQFSVSAKVTFIQSIVINGGKVGVGYFYPFAFVLILFSVFTEGLKAALLLKFMRKPNIKKIFKSIFLTNKASFKGLAIKYKDFPLFRAPEVTLNAVSGSLPILLLTFFFGPASAGFYSIGRTVLSIPSTLIGKSVGDVFYPRISEAANNGENLTKLIKKATLALGVIGVIPYGLVIISGPFLFGFIFGDEWVIAGEYARWIALWSFFGFMNRPSVRALPVLSAQSFHLIYTIIMLIVRVIVLVIGFYIFSNDIVAVALFGISGALLNIGLISITIYISKRYDTESRRY